MKKIILVVVGVLLIGVIAVILMTNLSSSNLKKNIETAKTTVMLNYNIDSIQEVTVYNGEESYYIMSYTKDTKKYIGVISKDYNMVFSIEEAKLANIDEKDYQIGYKDKKLIYEVQKEDKDGLNYYYYDALTKELIKKISVNR